MPDRAGDKWIALLILLAVGLTFSPLFTADFTNWDDPHTVARNPPMRAPGLDAAATYWRLFPPPEAKSPDTINHQFALWVPLTYSVWLAIAAIAQVRGGDGTIELNPYVFHAANVAFHAASTLLVWLILRRFIQSRWSAVAGALLWAVHPVQVEAVAWVSGLKDLLAGFLSLAAVWLYLLHADESMPIARRRARWWLATLCFAAAMLCKPAAVTTPLIVAVIDRVLLSRRPRQVLLAIIPWLAMAIPIAIIARAAQPALGEQQFPTWLRPLIPADSIAFYLGKLVWPWPLCVDYGRSPAGILRSGAIWWTWLFPAAALLASVLAARSGRRAPLAALLIFALAPLPVLGAMQFHFQQFSTTADHYLYVAMLGPAILAAWASAAVSRRVASMAGIVVLAALAGMSFLRSRQWHDARTLFSHEIRSNPGSSVCLNNLAAANAEAGNPAAAVELFRRALQADPDNMLAMKNLRQCLVELGQYDEALQIVRTELKRKYVPWLNPNHLGMTLLARGDYRSAVVHFTALARISPDDTDAHSLLALAEALAARHPATTRNAD